MADSALSPREIQARVRAGASVAEVAEAAGVSEEHIEPFAGPVLAERAFVVGSALDCPVRRRGEPSSNRTLQEIVTDRLKGHQVSFDDVALDAWRDDDRRWHLSARYNVAGEDRVAELLFDARARFSIPGNDEGRWLVGEQALTGNAPRDPDSEPTVDLNDEWAIVRAVQQGDVDSDPVPPVTADWGAEQHPESIQDDTELSAPIPIRRSSARRHASSDPPDYTPAQLEQVDGVYDIVPHDSEMDVLYEMLAGFNEDSVKIYAGLTQPITDQVPVGEPDDPPASAPDPSSIEGEVSATVDVVMIEASYQEYEVSQESVEPTRRIRRPRSKSGSTKAKDKQPAEAASDTDGDGPTPGEPEPATDTASGQGDDADAPQPRRSRKKGRAQVPSWDEIMFGGPATTPPED